MSECFNFNHKVVDCLGINLEVIVVMILNRKALKSWKCNLAVYSLTEPHARQERQLRVLC